MEIILVGHSFGGRIAAEIASKNPMWLKGLVLYASPLISKRSKLKDFRNMGIKLIKRFVPEKIKSLAYSDDYSEVKGTELEDIFKKTISYDQSDKLKNIFVPTIILWGERDNLPPTEVKTAKEINNLIVGSKLVIMPELGHNAHLDNPNLFYGYIRKALSSF